MVKFHFSLFSSAWLGLVNNLEENKFQWLGNDKSPYRNWCDGKRPAIDSEGCVLLRFDDPLSILKGCFELVDCSRTQHFICEADTNCNKNGFQTLTQVISKTIQSTKNDCKSCK